MDPEINAPLYIYDIYHPYFLSDFSDFFFSFETPEFSFLDIYPKPCIYQPTILTTIPIFLRSSHPPLFSVWITYGMGGFQPHSMDWTWTIFWLTIQPIFYSMLTMESIWNAYEMVPSICKPWTGPCGFHGISNEFKLQIHVLFHMDSMDKPINWAIKNSGNIRIEPSTSVTCYMHKHNDVLTAGLCNH